ncbi:MAG: AAA family ATPase, partial [Clostridia bacterium]|nr:AAA family ATPase [Clostridia bacterium]
MKIKEIYISSFGGVKDLKISAENGLNVIYGENEKGKTTLMSFIKMMFYGSERANQLLSKNIRKKYTPWDGSPMAGSIVFEARGRNFRLDREFRSSNSTDKVTLWDLDLGESKSVSGDVGNEIFGLSVGAFERTVFIGQFGFPESDAKSESEINSRLSNIALTGDESVSFETVKNRILKPKTALMSKSGNAGIYDKNMKCISDLETRLTKATEINETYRQNKEQLNLANAEILEMQKKADELKAKISAEQDIRNTEKLKKLLELKEELDDLNKTLLLDDGTLADEGYLRKLQLCLSLVSPIKEKLDSKVNEEKALKNSIEVFEGSSPEEKENQKKELEEKIAELEKVKSELKNAVDNKKREEKDIMFSLADTSAFKQKINKPFLFVAVASLIAALGSVFASFIIAAVFGVVALVFFALAFAMRPIDKEQIENMRKKASDIQQEISELEQNANKTNEELSSLKIKIETVNNAIGSNLEA